MNHPAWIVWHTAAHGHDDVDFDTTAVEINAWHIERGWNGIGYHYVIRKDGRLEYGRDESTPGAHVQGYNKKSIGICFSGHGDIKPLTPDQLYAGLALTKKLLKKYGLPIDRVVGHRELPNVHKTCPGTKVDMDQIRDLLEQEVKDNV